MKSNDSLSPAGSADLRQPLTYSAEAQTQQKQEEHSLRRRITISALKSAFALATIILAAVKLIFPIAAYFFMVESEYTGAQAGILFVVFSVTEAIGALVLAPLGDKVGFDKLLCFMYPGLIAGYIICALFPQNYPVFMVGFAIGGFFSDGYGLSVAYVSIVALSPADITTYCGYLEAAFGICSAVGPILATQLYTWDMAAPFFACCALSAICGLFMFCTFFGDQKKLQRAKQELQAKYHKQSVVAIKKSVNSNASSVDKGESVHKMVASLACLCGIEFFKAGAFSIYGTFMIMYLVEKTQDNILLAAIQLAIGNAFIVFGSVSSNYLLHKKHYSPKVLLMLLMLWMIGVVFVILFFVETFYWIMFVMCPQMGFIIGLTNVCISVSISKHAPQNKIGLASGIRLFMLDLGFGAGPLIAAMLYELDPNFTWKTQIAGYAAAFIISLVYYVINARTGK